MKTSICVLAIALLAASPSVAPAASSPAKSSSRSAARKAAANQTPHGARHRRRRHAEVAAEQAYASGKCRLTIPSGWRDFQGGKADPKDRTFGATIGRAADPKSMTATLKAMHGHVVANSSEMTLLQVELRGRAARQYWALTKPGPGCRATVTFSDSGQGAAARKIAESLRKSR